MKGGVAAAGFAVSILFGADSTLARESEFPWKSSARYEFQRFEKDQADWHVFTGSLERKFAPASLILEGFRVSRFGKWDEGVALDSYFGLWSRAYGNLRVQGVFDPDVMPTADVYAELFQGFGGGWEVSASYRNMMFKESVVNMPGISLGRYLGNWYLRGRAFANPSHGEIGYRGAGSARYFFESGDDFVEIGGALGRQVIVLGPGPRLDLRYATDILARAQRYFSRHLGVSLLVSFNDAERTPWGVGASVGVLGRW
ncbi:MAG: YaiO family outer membrane beta-barrel protein [Nitrospirae bacterium]|nr:YaiO family outer membrane beta-barrel protein [Nitrospirota bacterium]